MRPLVLKYSVSLPQLFVVGEKKRTSVGVLIRFIQSVQELILRVNSSDILGEIPVI